MTKQEKEKLKKLMKNYPSPVKICINNLHVNEGIEDLQELLREVIKCIEGKEGSGTDYTGIKKEIGLFKGKMIEVQDKNKKLNEDKEQEIKKISHNKPPKR